MAMDSHKARKRRHRRMRMTLSGSTARPRLNVFRSISHIYAQVIDDETGHTLASASTIDRAIAGQMAGKTKKQQAELVGEIVAERAREAGVESVVFDRGGYIYHGRVKALADGARKGGLSF